MLVVYLLGIHLRSTANSIEGFVGGKQQNTIQKDGSIETMLFDEN